MSSRKSGVPTGANKNSSINSTMDGAINKFKSDVKITDDNKIKDCSILMCHNPNQCYSDDCLHSDCPPYLNICALDCDDGSDYDYDNEHDYAYSDY